MNKIFTCIVCPKGCQIHVDGDLISGNSCPRGKNYVLQEIKNPTRIVTSSFKVKNSSSLVCPCKTSGPINKELIFDLMKEINKVEIEVPIKIGQIIIENVLNTGIDVISTKEID